MKARYGLATALRVSDRLVDRAVSTYESAFRLRETDRLEVYLQISADFQREGRLDEAMAALQAIISQHPNHVSAWFHIGTLYLRKGCPPEACDAFARAQQLGDSSFECHLGMADALTELEQREAAAAELRAAVALNPAAHPAHYQLGVCFDALGLYDEAVVAFSEAIRLAPKETTYHQSLGFTYDSMGKREDAVRCFKRAVELERRAQSQLGGHR